MDELSIDRGDALALIERDESHFWDHKSASGGGATIQKIACALANADGGDFVVGIEDRNSGSVGLDRWVGFGVMEDGNLVLEAVARDVTPPIPYTVEWLRIAGDESRASRAPFRCKRATARWRR